MYSLASAIVCGIVPYVVLYTKGKLMPRKRAATNGANGNEHQDAADVAAGVEALMAVRPAGPSVKILPLNEMAATFRLIGESPYMQCRFSQKAIQKIKETHMQGQQARSKRTREARDFDDDYQQAKHLFADGTCGIPCPAFRNALISTCRVVGFKMTIAKLSVFIVKDGVEIVDGTPLVRIEGTPERSILPVRNATGVIDLRVRPLWREWAVNLRV